MDYKRKLKLEQGSLSCPNLTISGNGRQPDIIIIDTDGILLRRDRSEKGWFFFISVNCISYGFVYKKWKPYTYLSYCLFV